MSIEAAIDDARAGDWAAATPVASRPAEPVAAVPTTLLSRRELEVAVLVARGLTNRQIAEQLVISEWTVDSHVRHILTKLEFRSRAQIAAWIAERAPAPPDRGQAAR